MGGGSIKPLLIALHKLSEAIYGFSFKDSVQLKVISFRISL